MSTSTESAATSTDIEIHVLRDGKADPPYTIKDARTYLHQGLLEPDQLAWCPGLSEWTPLKRVFAFLGVDVEADPTAIYGHHEPAIEEQCPYSLFDEVAPASRSPSKWLKAAGVGIFKTVMWGFIVLNYFGWLVAAIWLAIRGEWGAIGMGIAGSMIMPTVYMVAGLPALLLVLPIASACIESGKQVVGLTLMGANLIYNSALVLGWTWFVFHFFEDRATHNTIIPMLLWGYAVTVSPLGYMASKEAPDAIGTTLAVLMAQVAYVSLVVLYVCKTPVFTQVLSLTSIGLIEAVLLLTITRNALRAGF